MLYDYIDAFTFQETPIVNAAYEAQVDYCNRRKMLMFAPDKCIMCNGNIWEHISVEQAGKELITGCPICSYSFVN